MKKRSDILRDHVAGTLAAMIGRGKAISVDALVARTGLPERTIRSYMAGETAPPAHTLLRIGGVLGADLINALGEPIAIGGARNIDGDGCPPGAMLADMTRGAHALAEALSDGRFTHREKRSQIRKIRRLITELGRFECALYHQTHETTRIEHPRNGGDDAHRRAARHTGGDGRFGAGPRTNGNQGEPAIHPNGTAKDRCRSAGGATADAAP